MRRQEGLGDEAEVAGEGGGPATGEAERRRGGRNAPKRSGVHGVRVDACLGDQGLIRTRLLRSLYSASALCCCQYSAQRGGTPRRCA